MNTLTEILVEQRKIKEVLNLYIGSNPLAYTPPEKEITEEEVDPIKKLKEEAFTYKQKVLEEKGYPDCPRMGRRVMPRCQGEANPEFQDCSCWHLFNSGKCYPGEPERFDPLVGCEHFMVIHKEKVK